MLVVSFLYKDGTSGTIEVSETATAAAQTAAIQTALSNASKAGGGTVSLSAGTWTLAGTGKAADGCLRMGSDTTLEGAGLGATTLKLADGSSAVTGIIRTDRGKTLADGSFSTVSNVTVRGLTIDGNNSKTTGDVDGFYCGPKPGTAQADTNITLDRVEIANCSRYGFDPHEQTVGMSITNCSAHHNGVDGFVLDFCSDVTMSNNVAFANGRHGFNIVTGSHDVVMTNNDAFANGGSGITVQTGDNEIREFTHGITITGGVVTGNGRAGIDVHMATDVDITGVTVSNNTGSGVSLAGTEHVTLTGNSISGNSGVPVKIDGYLQDFNDTDAANDRWVGTKAVIIDGVTQAEPQQPTGTTLWTWKVTDGDDVITGSSGKDVIAAASGNDTVNGGAGDDTLYGNDGNDILDGGTGNDKLYGGAGNDRLVVSSGFDIADGGAGNDTIDFSKFSSAITVDLSSSSVQATSNGGAVADLISIENVIGTSYADVITGNSLANVLDGGGGADRLDGGAGNDTLIGGGGNDTLIGGAGNDVLTGGTGSDAFRFGPGWGQDTITDFTRKQDKIAISGVNGLDAFSKLAISQSGADAVIAYGADKIMLTGVQAASLTATDFIFS